jgi:hypothetical protein
MTDGAIPIERIRLLAVLGKEIAGHVEDGRLPCAVQLDRPAPLRGRASTGIDNDSSPADEDLSGALLGTKQRTAEVDSQDPGEKVGVDFGGRGNSKQSAFLKSTGHEFGGQAVDVGNDPGSAALLQKSCGDLANSGSGPADGSNFSAETKH